MFFLKLSKPGICIVKLGASALECLEVVETLGLWRAGWKVQGCFYGGKHRFGRI